jgi:putative ABC transport system permease protein
MNSKGNMALAFRHMKSDKVNSVINLSGLILSLGIATVIIVFIFNELGYNKSFTNSKHIYRILNYNSTEDKVWANTPFILGEKLTQEFAEIETCVQQFNINNIDVKIGNEFISEKEMLCTGSNFFSVFGIQIREGTLSDFDLSDGKILISTEIAKKYFKEKNPIGQMLTVRFKGVEYPMEVAAVLYDMPDNVTNKGSLFANLNFAFEHLSNNIITTGEEKPDKQSLKESWDSGVFFTNYLLINNGVDLNDFEKKLHNYGNNLRVENLNYSLSLQPLTDIYFKSGKIIDNNSTGYGNLSMLYILAFLGFLILIIASINYLNLSMSQAFTRSKTFAVRKVCGAPKSNLMWQMGLESILYSMIALPFAVILAHISLPYLSSLLGKSYEIDIHRNILITLGFLFMISISTGLITGLLISLKISSFGLVNMLKGSNKRVGNTNNLRKVMVVFQLVVFIALIAVMILVQKQVQYAFTKDLGIDKEGLMRVQLGDHNYQLIKQKLENDPNIISVSGALWIPPHKGKMIITIPRVDNPAENVTIYGDFSDYGFANTMGMKIIQGEDFTPGKHISGVLVNKTAVAALGLTETIGEQTAFGPVIGVVSDYDMYSIHEKIPPMIIGLNPDMCLEVAIRINTSDINGVISGIEKTWKTTGGTTAFDFDFTDDILNQLYDSDLQFAKIIGLMAFVAILIASLGLFGLSLQIGLQKTKEIGIRKVNGACIYEVLIMLNKDFLKWIAIAFLIATPIAYYAMNKWLQNFAYKTELSWWIFALAGLLALGIALLTVSWQSWRAATRNPVESLRDE